MADTKTIRETVEQLVNEVFATGIPALRDQVVEGVVQQLKPLFAPSAQANRVDQLNTALAAIHGATAQSDVLRALLDGMAIFCGRVALFLMRGNAAVGWQARGFQDNDTVKSLTINVNAGLAARVVSQCAWIEGPAAEFEPRLASDLDKVLNCLLAPLAVRERIVALIYTDGEPQTGGPLDRSALEMLVRAASLWIELLILRKSALSNSNAPVNVGTSPGNGHAPDPQPVLAQPVVSAPLPPETRELHRKAQRFAKLLVDEIKLYHQDKVVEGRQHRDLYARLKDDIDKSRLSYDKRYSRTGIVTNDYFTEELIRNLADNNPNLLGSSFPR
jgi:hypothetical protein